MESIENLYQGEDWNFTISGDEGVDLTSSDFRILIYPYGEPENVTKVEKSQCSATEHPNEYAGKIAYSTTKSLKTGFYSFEVLLIKGGQERSVFAKFRAFCCQPAASKNEQ